VFQNARSIAATRALTSLLGNRTSDTKNLDSAALPADVLSYKEPSLPKVTRLCLLTIRLLWSYEADRAAAIFGGSSVPRTLMTTRRFIARPSRVSLLATGLSSP